MTTQYTQLQTELLQLLETKEQELHYNKFKAMYPEKGPFSRDKYPAAIALMNASSQHSQLAFIAANRTGKTTAGAYLMAMHLTGDYSSWYCGKKFSNAINAWASGKTNQKTKEIIQYELLGPINDIGSGMIPKDKILRITKKPGVADAIEMVEVRHASGGVSILEFKSYEQGRDGFEGTKRQVIWLDEEPQDESIYSECLMRLADPLKPGIIYCTFTPLYGLSGLALRFLPDLFANKDGHVKNQPDMFAVQISWDDVPHLTEADKKRLWDGSLPHEREARSKGIPAMGAGAIYPVLDDKIVVDPFPIPSWWPRAYGLDTGWKCTAAIWGALNPDDNTLYIYSEYVAGQEHIAIHSHAIKERGKWIWGAGDPAGINQEDGRKIFDLFLAEGLNLEKADKRSRDSGILKVSQMFEAGKLKFFSTCTHIISDRRKYHRDEKGRIVEKDDHTLDALRYLCTTGMELLSTEDNNIKNTDSDNEDERDRHTGY